MPLIIRKAHVGDAKLPRLHDVRALDEDEITKYIFHVPCFRGKHIYMVQCYIFHSFFFQLIIVFR
jgi:hypothetical protein